MQLERAAAAAAAAAAARHLAELAEGLVARAEARCPTPPSNSPPWRPAEQRATSGT